MAKHAPHHPPLSTVSIVDYRRGPLQDLGCSLSRVASSLDVDTPAPSCAHLNAAHTATGSAHGTFVPCLTATCPSSAASSMGELADQASRCISDLHRHFLRDGLSGDAHRRTRRASTRRAIGAARRHRSFTQPCADVTRILADQCRELRLHRSGYSPADMETATDGRTATSLCRAHHRLHESKPLACKNLARCRSRTAWRAYLTLSPSLESPITSASRIRSRHSKLSGSFCYVQAMVPATTGTE